MENNAIAFISIQFHFSVFAFQAHIFVPIRLHYFLHTPFMFLFCYSFPPYCFHIFKIVAISPESAVGLGIAFLTPSTPISRLILEMVATATAFVHFLYVTKF